MPRAQAKPRDARSRPLNNYPAVELETMESRGYLPAILVAAALGMSPMGVYKWIGAGKVEGKQIEDRRYVTRASVRKHVGAETYSAALTGKSVKDLLLLRAKVKRDQAAR